MNKETWKAIPGFEGLYEVSDLGRVRSLDRTVEDSKNGFRRVKGRILKQGTNTVGYYYVNLSKNNKAKVIMTHTLVALTFIGERPKGYHICHKNDIRKDNKLENLRYDNENQNMIDIYRNGVNGNSGKLSIEQVLEIRRLYKTGNYKYIELAEIYNVNFTTIGRIVTRKTYYWLNDDGTIDNSQTAVS